MRTRCLAAILACLPVVTTVWAHPPSECTSAAQGFTAQPRPQAQQLSGVRYITGGIGIDEARAMRAERLNYALALTFVQRTDGKDGFLSGVQLEIENADGLPLFCATSGGPYLFVDLPPGRYRVSATTGGGRRIDRSVVLPVGGRQDLAFVWPASTSAR